MIVENTPLPSGWQTWSHFPPEILKAYRDGDHVKINKCHEQAANDLKPMYENIKSHGKKAFVKVKNVAGEEFQIALSGPPKKPTGCMFVWDSKSLKHAKSQDDVPNNDFYIGTISYQSKILGVSKGTWDDKIVSIGTSVISAVAALIAGWMAKRLVGMGIKQAAQIAAEELAATLIADGALEAGAAEFFATFAVGLLAGTAVGLLVFLLTIVLIGYLKKNYQVVVMIQNYDTESEYEISDCYTDNGYLDDHSSFKAQTLSSPTSEILSYPWRAGIS